MANHSSFNSDEYAPILVVVGFWLFVAFIAVPLGAVVLGREAELLEWIGP